MALLFTRVHTLSVCSSNFSRMSSAGLSSENVNFSVSSLVESRVLKETRAKVRVTLYVKRICDLLIALATLVIVSPFLVLISIGVLIDDGFPIIFRQRRLGRDARQFQILKFRTMKVGSRDIRLKDGSSLSAMRDARLTRLGTILREWSLDELPQLWNVLCGDMSLVGPRPDQSDQLQFYAPSEVLKLAVRPGLTGLAQVRGRNAINWKQRKRYDVFYVRHISLLLDLKILAQTVPTVLGRRNTTVRKVLDDA